MDTVSARSLFDLGMENSEIINREVQAPWTNHDVSVLNTIHPFDSLKPTKFLETSSKIISFENMIIKPEPNIEESMGNETIFTRPPSRIPSRAKEHILAERKRRERLTQRFIALSSHVPGLKKLDKASVLGDAIKYIKHLQDRKKILEKECANNSTQSVACIRKSVISKNEEGSFETLPAIEVRSSNSDLLIRIQCERHNGVVSKITSEMEKLNLILVNTVAMPFGDSILDITIIAQIDKEFNLTAKDLKEILQSAAMNM